MSKRSRRNRVFKKGDRVIISQRYKGAVGPKVHGRAGVVHRVMYPTGGGKFVLVHLDGESVLSVILTFADELDREPASPAPADVVYHDSIRASGAEPTPDAREALIQEWSEDEEGKALVQAIHDRKTVLHAFVLPADRDVQPGDTVRYLGQVGGE